MTDFLAEKKKEIEQRVDELRPYVQEAALLKAALAALENQPKRRGRPPRELAA